jgi:hypothetical protein
MVIYNGVHYDALAISPGPRSLQEEDATEFNPRTKRGKMIIATAQKLVRRHCSEFKIQTTVGVKNQPHYYQNTQTDSCICMRVCVSPSMSCSCVSVTHSWCMLTDNRGQAVNDRAG